MMLRRRLALMIVVALCALGAPPAVASQRILPVPQVTIYPGDTIGDDQIVERGFSMRAVANVSAIESRELLIGRVAKRTLLPGHPIPPNAVADPDVVTRGMPVQVVFQQGALRITTYASPLQSGGIGDVISVRNEDSGVTVHGIIQADGSVRVGGM